MTTPVTFELAKLLKNKNFDSDLVSNCYTISGDLKRASVSNKWIDKDAKKLGYNHTCIAPTISEVVMWLYEKHGIWISVYSDKALNWESLFSIKIDWIYPKDSPDAEDIEPKYFNYKGKNEFNNPTEAYLAAIEYTLNNLI